MARRRTGRRWLAATALVALFAVAPCRAGPAPAATSPEKVNKDKSVQMNKATPPDIAVLDYLGRYEEAADGLDPLGLAESAE